MPLVTIIFKSSWNVGIMERWNVFFSIIPIIHYPIIPFFLANNKHLLIIYHLMIREKYRNLE